MSLGLGNQHIQSIISLVPFISSAHQVTQVVRIPIPILVRIIFELERNQLTCPLANLGNKSGISSPHFVAHFLFPSINPFNSGNLVHMGESVDEEA